MTVMELKRLMVDDFVYSKKHHQIVRVCNVGSMYVQYYVNGVLFESDDEDIEPIVLTEALLKKFSFKTRRIVGWEGVKNYFWKGGNMQVRLISLFYKEINFFDIIIEPVDSGDLCRGDFRCAIGGYMRFTPVRYVHEMQQAFRLNGIDKEFNLTREDKK